VLSLLAKEKTKPRGIEADGKFITVHSFRSRSVNSWNSREVKVPSFFR